MSKIRMEDSLALLNDQSVDLILHAQRLRQEFTELSKASKLLRIESMQLREDVGFVRKFSTPGSKVS